MKICKFIAYILFILLFVPAVLTVFILIPFVFISDYLFYRDYNFEKLGCVWKKVIA